LQVVGLFPLATSSGAASMNEATTQQPATAGRSAHIVFTGVRKDFFRLVLHGAALELVTAGFYRFWLVTDMRRHLWSNTSLDGHAFEYTGLARELLIGFLLALAILVPIYLIYFLIGIEAERAQTLASIPLVLFFYVFGQFAIYRARRYRASRTIWRGVRFWMTGSGWAYAWRSSLWAFLALITLGLALPWREAAIERYKMRHTHYGNLPASFDGTGWGLFKRGWWLWLLAFLILTLPFVYPLYKAITWKWWVEGLRFDKVRFESDLRAGALMGTYWATYGWVVLLVIAFTAILGLAMSAMVMIGVPANQIAAFAREHPYIAFTATVVNYLILVLAIGVVIRVYLLRDVWQRAAASVTVHQLEAADNVQAKGEAASALGEGFADGLDVGGF
jgi:uncharacterized membrane protein YjgN (DUF898 family)